MATATKPKAKQKATFHSRHGAFRIVRVPEFVGTNSWGQQIKKEYATDQNGRPVTRVVYEFERGTLEVDEATGKNWHVLPDGPGGTPQDTLEFLRAHEELNQRFHEAGREPDRPQPDEATFNRRLRAALVALDVDSVTEMLKTERETHKREALIQAADETRKEILQIRQQMESAPPPEAA